MNIKHKESTYVAASVFGLLISVFLIYFATDAFHSHTLEISVGRGANIKRLYTGHEIFLPALGLYFMGFSLLPLSIVVLLNRGPVKSKSLINALGATSLFGLILLLTSVFLKTNV